MSRSLYGAFLVAAGIVIGIAASILVAILVWGGWPPALYGQIVGILGKALLGAGGLLTLVIIFLGLGGPVKRLSLGTATAHIETEGDD